jgi:hypothetical protein
MTLRCDATLHRSGAGARKDMLFSGIAMPALVTDDERRRRDKRHHLAASNVATLLLAALRSLPAYTDSRCVCVCSLRAILPL